MLAVVLLSLSFGCTQLTEGAYWAATISVAGKHASAAAGILNTGGNVVGGIGALLVPITAEAFRLGTGDRDRIGVCRNRCRIVAVRSCRQAFGLRLGSRSGSSECQTLKPGGGTS